MNWLVCYCASRSEFLVESQLVTAGYESYFPVYKRRLHRRYGGDVFSPLFSRYVFVKTHVLWKVIHAFRGVNGFLTNEDIPLTVPDQVIEEIKKRQARGEFDERPAPKWARQTAKSFRELKKMLDGVDNRAAA